MRQTPNNPILAAFAVFTAISTLFLICVGGLVTSHGAGMAVPDWPNTFGYNMFLFPVSQWVGGIFYEHSHRRGNKEPHEQDKQRRSHCPER